MPLLGLLGRLLPLGLSSFLPVSPAVLDHVDSKEEFGNGVDVPTSGSVTVVGELGGGPTGGAGRMGGKFMPELDA